jgi:hypothetical protein
MEMNPISRYQSCTESEIIGSRRLWKSVLILALRDALSSNLKEALEQSRAYNWIMDGTEDFHFVCESAGYHPKKVQEKFINHFKGKRPKFGRKY